MFLFFNITFFQSTKKKAELNVCVIKVKVKYKSASTVSRNGKSPETMRTTRPWTKSSCFCCLQKQACQLSTRQREFLIFTMISFSLLSLPAPAWLPLTRTISSSLFNLALSQAKTFALIGVREIFCQGGR